MRRWQCIVLSFLMTIGILSLGYFVFSKTYLRMWESMQDFWLSVKFCHNGIFGIDNDFTPTITEYSKVLDWKIFLPLDFESFKVKIIAFLKLLIDKDNFISWFYSISDELLFFCIILVVIVPVWKILVAIMKKIYGIGNRRHNKDTWALALFKLISKVIYQPIKTVLIGGIKYLKEHSHIWIIWLVIFALHINLGSIIISLLAYLIYFIMTFDIGTIYPQVVKLGIDLQVPLRFFPWWVLSLVSWLLFLRYRKRLALNKLRHFEARNCGFIKELPIVSMACGAMGMKKTTLITDMILSQEVMFRQQAFEIIRKNDMKFPYFPWISFEKQIRHCIKYGQIYNLATVKEFVSKKRERFYNKKARKKIYKYDYKRYGLSFNNGIYEEDLFDVLATYGQAYFIYILYSSLIISNYSIMTDNQIISYGNFPMWDMEFFPEEYRDKKRHSHILDFDVLRLGRKLLENNPNIGSFEFGIVAITEIGKERGNNLELQEIKKKDDTTNQKNDLFNTWLKMCRHSSTVDNFPFIKVFTDEQRPESWGADARDLCDIIRIVKSGKMQLAIPLYIFEEMISEITFDGFIDFYYYLRFKRGDNTLLCYILKGIVSRLFRRNIEIYNRYGYTKLYLERERGIMDGKKEKKKYYLMNGKIYRERFSTDCFSDYFNELAKKTKIGMNDYKEYLNKKASVSELKLQNSYFINNLYKDTNGA